MSGEAKISVILELKNKLKTGLEQAKQSLNKTVGEVKSKLNDLKTSHINAFKAMEDRVPGFSNIMSTLGNPYVIVTAGVLALTAAFSKASAMGQEFDSAMAKTNVTLQMKKPELDKAKGEVLDIASRSTLKNAVTQAPAALNVLASANLDDDPVKNYQLSLKALEPTLNAAKWGFTDVETVARAASLSMNASGIKDTTKIYDVFAATLNKGNVEFSTIAQYLPKLIAQAKQAGLGFEQTAGAYAFMTQKFTGEKSATMLENIVKTLQDTDRVHAFKKLGIDVFNAEHKMRSLVEISTDLNKAVGGLSPEMKNMALNSLNLDTEASAGFSAMMQNVEGLKGSIDATTNSAGAAKTAFENAKTPMDGWNVISNSIDVAWTKLGQTLNSVVIGPIGTWLVDHKGLLETIGWVILGVAAAWGAYTLITNSATIALGLMTAGQWLLNTALSANPIGIVVTAIGLLIGGLIAAYKKSETFRAVLSGLMEVARLVSDVFVGLGKTIIGAFTLDPTMIKEGLLQSATAVKSIIDGGISKAFNKGYDNSMKESAAKAAADATAAAKEKAPANLYEKPNAKVQSVLDKEKEKQDKKDRREAGMTGGSQTKVININKVSMIDGNWISNNKEFAQMDRAAAERFLMELFQRSMINLGRSYS